MMFDAPPCLYFRACGEPTEDPTSDLYEAVVDGRVVRSNDPRLILLEADVIPLAEWRAAA